MRLLEKSLLDLSEIIWNLLRIKTKFSRLFTEVQEFVCSIVAKNCKENTINCILLSLQRIF